MIKNTFLEKAKFQYGIAKDIFKDIYRIKCKKNNILVLGSNGMLGYDVMRLLKNKSQQQESDIGIVIGLDIEDGIDFTKRYSLGTYFMNSIKYDYCINCIAYTDTKKAETTEEGRCIDYKLNALVPKYIAESCAYWGVKLIHISTDYVFSEKSSRLDGVMFEPDDQPFPVNTYGKNKLLGEQFVMNAFSRLKNNFAILRTSWLYGMNNNKSFIHKFMKNVMQKVQKGEDVEMTSNEVSIPTSTLFVAECIYETISKKLNGILHAVCQYEDESQQHEYGNVPDDLRGVTRAQFAQEILTSFCKDDVVHCYTLSTDVSLCDVKVIPVEIDTYQPKYSALKTSFSSDKTTPGGDYFNLSTFGWITTLRNFINDNRRELLSWAKQI